MPKYPMRLIIAIPERNPFRVDSADCSIFSINRLSFWYAAENCVIKSFTTNGFLSFILTRIELDSSGLSSMLRRVSMCIITLLSNP